MTRNKQHYTQAGRDAYNRGRVIIAGAIPAHYWQRRAFADGYAQARRDWRAKHPRGDELAAALKRSRAFCRAMIRDARRATT